MRHPTKPKLDNVLLKWFQSARSQNLPLSCLLLIKKASDLAISLGYSDDDIKTIDSSWIQRFRKRHQICLKFQSGESASVSHESIGKWINERLPLLCQKCHPTDISMLMNVVCSENYYQIVH